LGNYYEKEISLRGDQVTFIPPHCKAINWTLGSPSLLCLALKHESGSKILHHQPIAPRRIAYDCNWFNNTRKTLLLLFLKRQASEICQWNKAWKRAFHLG